MGEAQKRETLANGYQGITMNDRKFRLSCEHQSLPRQREKTKKVMLRNVSYGKKNIHKSPRKSYNLPKKGYTTASENLLKIPLPVSYLTKVNCTSKEIT